VPNLTSYDT